MIGTRLSRVAFSLHTGSETRRGQMTKENLTTTDLFFGKSNWNTLHWRDTVLVFAIFHMYWMSHSLLHRLQKTEMEVDLWIKVDRYLLCACQRGSTSSVGSTGTGSCGAGQSDTLCLTWISKWLGYSSYIHTDIYSYFLLRNNTTTATTVCWLPAGVRRCGLFFLKGCFIYLFYFNLVFTEVCKILQQISVKK